MLLGASSRSQKQSFVDVLQKRVPKNFANVAGKHLHWSVATLLKINFNTSVFQRILRIFKNTVFIEHPWWLHLSCVGIKNFIASDLNVTNYFVAGNCFYLWKTYHVSHNFYKLLRGLYTRQNVCFTLDNF